MWIGMPRALQEASLLPHTRVLFLHRALFQRMFQLEVINIKEMHWIASQVKLSETLCGRKKEQRFRPRKGVNPMELKETSRTKQLVFHPSL